MPTRKIADLPEQQVCRHPEHNPPNMMVFEPGIYEHECPRCGKTKVFTVGPKPTLRAKSKDARDNVDMSADYAFGYDWKGDNV